MKVLELFAGSRSVGKVCDRLGYDCFSIDIKKFEGINLVKDIELLKPKEIPFVPDFIWASPPCTSYSIAAISHHRRNQTPVSDFAKKSDELVKNTLAIIDYFLSVNEDLIWFIENPVGMLHKMSFMKPLDRAKVYYCRYGDTRMKPTFLFTNHLKTLYNPDGWQPRRKCWNGNIKCHHEAAPRGSKTGTQGLKNDYERSKIPSSLIEDIFQSIKAINNYD
jgi:site-specific DNA-cytosine methylase